MGQALYRKTRPKSLDEVVGQEHITVTLKNALQKGAISHAYLFTGPRGVGKTSVARILAHDINGLPYADDSMHLDIIEIDAASNRRIDEIRDLRDRVNIAPTSAKYKIYIIDEVHMLTREAFNALLKTLEEPPAHVVFILATTESRKLPATIVSRTQRFTFKPIALETVVKHLRHIAKSEKIDITDSALELIAKHGEGSFRDSISLLDQAASAHGKIDDAYVRAMLGIPSDEATEQLVQNLNNHAAVQVIQNLEHLRDQGFSAAHIAKQLGSAYRKHLLSTTGVTQKGELKLMQNLLQVPAAHDPEKYLEIILLEFALSGLPAQSTAAAPNVAVPAKIETAKKTEKLHVEKTVKPKSETQSTTNESPEPTTPKTKVLSPAKSIDPSVWPKVMAELKKKHNTLYGVVRMVKPMFTDDTLELGFAFAFHRKRLTEKKNQQILAGIIHDITGKDFAIRCIDDNTANYSSSTTLQSGSSGRDSAATAAQAKPDLASISNIFGGGELLGS